MDISDYVLHISNILSDVSRKVNILYWIKSTSTLPRAGVMVVELKTGEVFKITVEKLSND